MWDKILAYSAEALLECLLPTSHMSTWVSKGSALHNPWGQGQSGTGQPLLPKPWMSSCQTHWASRSPSTQPQDLLEHQAAPAACPHFVPLDSTGTARVDMHKATYQHVARMQQNCPVKAPLGTNFRVGDPSSALDLCLWEKEWRGHLGSSPGSDSSNFRVQEG